VLRFTNSSLRAAVRRSSVVHTGVKSDGWLKNTAHEFFFHSWNETSPPVDFASTVRGGWVWTAYRRRMGSHEPLRDDPIGLARDNWCASRSCSQMSRRFCDRSG
jgi:hypothetical protein